MLNPRAGHQHTAKLMATEGDAGAARIETEAGRWIRSTQGVMDDHERTLQSLPHLRCSHERGSTRKLSRLEFSSYRFPGGHVGVGDAHILGREGRSSDRGNPADQHSLRDFCHERGHLGIDLGTSPSSGGQLQDHQGGSGGEEIEGTVHSVLLLARMGEARPAPNG
jgi:hypothetical protein